MASEQGWVNAVKGDDEFGLLRYQLTFTDDGAYGPIRYTVRIRGVDLEGTVTPQEIGATMGGVWWQMIEDHLRREHHLPACDRRSPEQKRIAALERERDEALALAERHEGEIAAIRNEMPICTDGCPRDHRGGAHTDFLCQYQRTCALLVAAAGRGADGEAGE